MAQRTLVRNSRYRQPFLGLAAVSLLLSPLLDSTGRTDAAAMAVAGFVASPASGPLSTTFTVDIEFPVTVPLGCSVPVRYVVNDPNNIPIVTGILPANDPFPASPVASFQITVGSTAILGFYTITGSCPDPFTGALSGSFEVTAPTPPQFPPIGISLSATRTHPARERLTSSLGELPI